MRPPTPLLVLLVALPLAANGPPPPRELTLDLVFADGAGEALWVLDAATGKAAAALRREEIDQLVWSPAGDAIALLAEGDLSLLGLRDRSLVRLTATEETEEAPAF